MTNNFNTKAIIGAILFVGVAFFCCHPAGDYVLNTPKHFPVMDIPANNLPNHDKIHLGQRLFFDKNISLDSTISCVSCHKPAYAFADNKPVSEGIHGKKGKRNSPSLFNVGYNTLVNKDGGAQKLDIQALIPIEDEHEMGIKIQDLAKRLENDESYHKLFIKAFDQGPNAFTISRALGIFVRTFISSNSLYDQYILGDSTALSISAKRGLQLFNSKKLQCSTCHTGVLFTDNSFQNNGLLDDYSEDLGRALITLDSLDQGKFRVPSLRNVALTPPYMHRGQLLSLSEVIDHYSTGGKSHVNQSHLVQGFDITEQEKNDLIAFLQSLTEEKK